MRHASRARSAIFAPLGDHGRAARVEQRLTEAIRSGLLADGERLPSEPELASMLGVATVTAREALVSLRARGLVTTTRGRGGGSFVTRPQRPDDSFLGSQLAGMTRVELRDRGTVYRVILAGCAELAAQYADEEDADTLADLLIPTDGTDEADVAAWRHADAELYLSLAALTQSARMTREVVRLEADFGLMLRLPLADDDFRAATGEHHRRLVAAVAEHRSDDARRDVHQHIDEALARLVELHAGLR